MKIEAQSENGFLIKKIVYAKEHWAKTLVYMILLECSLEISSKMVIFRAGENTIMKYKHFVNS